MSVFTKYVYLFFLLFLIMGIQAQKKADSLFKPRYYFYAAGYAPNISTSIRFDSKTAHLGTVMSLEENLHFDDKPYLFRLDAVAKIAKRHTAAATFLSINRSRNFTIEKEIKYLDTTLDVGASAKMYFNTNYWALSYRYSLFAKPSWSAGLSFGLRVLSVKTGISAESKHLGSYSSNSSLIIPAALIGLHGSAYLTKRFQFRYTWEYLKLNVSGINIYVFDNNLDLEYYFLKNVGIGASYSNVAYIVKDIPISSEFSGEIKYNFYGFSLFIAARF